MSKRVTIRRAASRSYDISCGGARIGCAHDSRTGPVWYVRSDDPPIALRNSALVGLSYETTKQAAQAAAAYARAQLLTKPTGAATEERKS